MTINAVYYFQKLLFDKQKLVSIQHKDGSYDEYTYDNDLVSEILEFNTNRVLVWAITYSYDEQGRVIKIFIKPGAAGPVQISREKHITYAANQITCVCTWSDGVYVRYEFMLNERGEILSETLFDEEGNQYPHSISYSYTNKNVTGYRITNAFNGAQEVEVASFTYNTLKNDHNYKKYLFGSHWKNNSFLGHLYQFRALPSIHYESGISENLISSFSDKTINVSFDYVLNAHNQIVKETQKFTTASQNIKIQSIYKYAE